MWRASRIDGGWGLWAGRSNVLACWVPKRKSDAEVEAEFFAEAEEHEAAYARAAAEARARLAAAKARIVARCWLYRVRSPRAASRAAGASRGAAC